MGHIRVGRLPKVRGWRQVIGLLESVDSSSSDLAAATANAAKGFLAERASDPTLAYCYWLLTQITYQARTDRFSTALSEIGLEVSQTKDALGFLGKITNVVRREVKSRGETFPFSEIVQLSLREVLTETIGQRSQSLFGTTLEDIRSACRQYSTHQQFARLARLYFSKVLNRTLQFFVSKESANYLGAGGKFADLSQLSDFNLALESYCYQSAKIVEEFAGGWYSKRNWQGEISEQDARGFVAVAFQKLRAEIAREEQGLEVEE